MIVNKDQYDENPILLTPSKVAKYLSINYRKVLDLIIMGKLPAYKIGGQYRIQHEDLEQYLKDSKYNSYFNSKQVKGVKNVNII
jgi:excisionase family DNA binding protein